MTNRYLVAGCTPWARRVFDQTLSKLPGEWGYVEDRDALNAALFGDQTRNRPPAYIFFLHWRWIVPASIVNRLHCIGFHIGQLPEQRGGTPLQWRILEGWQHGILTAFRMTEGIDDGPVYQECQIPLHGSAEECYAAAMGAAAHAIQVIIGGDHTPREQTGIPKVYPRRQGAELSWDQRDTNKVRRAYDLIRCTDAEGYPRAYFDVNGLRFEFDRAVLYDGRIKADVVITEANGG